VLAQRQRACAAADEARWAGRRRAVLDRGCVGSWSSSSSSRPPLPSSTSPPPPPTPSPP
jgi:hypothetical protein